MSIILDASISLAWVFDDEATPTIDAIFDRIASSGAFAPGLWRLEVANGLRMAVRRSRMSLEFRDEALARLARLPIEIDQETNLHAWQATLSLADRYALTVYDAAYLELAQRRRLPLATLDRRLDQAAREAGVESGLLN
ncbi:type II toxin-antitoxin system VapC family toxin [Mesorhizobium sp. BAC0120]|uniref:type II toxin-antitoxin system VapC family toxin n=1 Tax=Mesorhizobium sp. BAC0120 TaxID=3090670 RepID=UPI00298D2B65|nr:type II toxin-antitoxin system VapC family toxin [Mesorhizobium sp. BAC0120]MDW6021800.1 type II toxin-antitoxin system VapC family toxin [Mesorhizobium sp. BAC0120]